MSPKKQFSSLSLVLTLGIICAAAGLALAAVYEATKAPIAEAKRQDKLQAIRYVLPEYANQPDKEAVALSVVANRKTGEIVSAQRASDAEAPQAAAGQEVREIEAYPAKDKAGRTIAWAIPVSDPRGYGGTIKMMVGLGADGKVIRIKPLEVPETPGLGDGIAKDWFLKQMEGQSDGSVKWQVSKDGGGIDGVTAATISSRAAIGAVSSAFPIASALEGER